MPEHMLAKTRRHSMKQTNVEKFKCMFKYMIIKSGITCPMFISNALTLIQIVFRHITEIYLGLRMYTSDRKQ